MVETHRIIAAAVAGLLCVTACAGDGEPRDDGVGDNGTGDQGTGTAPASKAEPTTPTDQDPERTGQTTEPGQPTDSPTEPTETATEPTAGFGDFGVAAGHPLAVDAGMAMLEDGGNAVDAAIASAFSMAVVEPLSSGPGGGGAALVVPHPDSTAVGTPEKPVAYDYREVVQTTGTVPDSGTGVPGFVAGLELLHAEHGQLPWDQVMEPAITQAEDGVPVTWWVAQELRTDRGRAASGALEQFTHDDGDPLAEGDVLVQPELAATLRTVAEDPRHFYEGDLADLLAQVDGIDSEGLAGYEVDVREPPRGAIGDYEVLAAAPALSGVALIQLLQVAEAGGLADTEPGSAAFLDILAGSWLVADDTIQTLLGDPRFTDVPVDELTDPQSNAAAAESGAVGDAAAGPTAIGDAAPGQRVEGAQPTGIPTDGPSTGNTTHLSVVDEDGLAVSMTNTITNFWGSGQEVGGFFVNDHLIRFDIGETDANEPGAGRRPVSYMAPAVLLDDQDRPVLVVGSPGGQRIPNIEAAVITRWALHGQELQEAVDAPRAHLDGAELRVEDLPAGTVDELTGRGYSVTPVPLSWSLFGSVQALELDHGTGRLIGATDDRRTGAWDSGASR